jgi:hypothetical protein
VPLSIKQGNIIYSVILMNSDSIVFLGYYSAEQYQLLLQCANDLKKLDRRWEDWLSGYLKAKSFLSKQFAVEDFHVDVKKMNEYFRSKKLKNNGENRSRYITQEGMKAYNERKMRDMLS